MNLKVACRINKSNKTFSNIESEINSKVDTLERVD